MAVGVVLAIGQIVGTRRWHIKAGRWRKTLFVALCSFAVILCGYGLFKSYSRGAWLGAVCGLAYLIAKSEIRNQKLRSLQGFRVIRVFIAIGSRCP